MKIGKNLLVLSCLSAVLLPPALSSSEMKITLKNGRSIIADDCRQINNTFLCDIAGGTVEFDRQEIESIKEVKMQRRVTDTEPRIPTGTEPVKNADTLQTPATDREEQLIRGLSPDQAEKLKQLNEKKSAMRAERDRLIKEREQLHQDVKDAGVVRTQEQFDALRNRIADLDKKINGFNEEVKKINEEEGGIREDR